MNDTGWIACTPFNTLNDDNEYDWNYMYDDEICEYEDIMFELEIDEHERLICPICNSDIPEHKVAFNVDGKVVCSHCFDRWIKQFRHERIENPYKVDLYGVIPFKLN